MGAAGLAEALPALQMPRQALRECLCHQGCQPGVPDRLQISTAALLARCLLRQGRLFNADLY